jgi:hypothetical protein
MSPPNTRSQALLGIPICLSHAATVHCYKPVRGVQANPPSPSLWTLLSLRHANNNRTQAGHRQGTQAGYRQDTGRTQAGHRQDTGRTQAGHRQDTGRTQAGHRQGTQAGYRQDTGRTQAGHRQDTGRTQAGHRQDTGRTQAGHRQDTGSAQLTPGPNLQVYTAQSLRRQAPRRR